MNRIIVTSNPHLTSDDDPDWPERHFKKMDHQPQKNDDMMPDAGCCSVRTQGQQTGFTFGVKNRLHRNTHNISKLGCKKTN
jgi:hypothetical protein